MICLFMSMTFPASIQDGIIFDIRYVIMFFGMVYGGITTGVFLIVEFLVYRLLIGGQGLFSAIIILSLTFSLSALLSNLYRRRSEYRKLITLIAGICFSIIPIGTMFATEYQYTIQHLKFNILVMPVQNFLGIWILISF